MWKKLKWMEVAKLNKNISMKRLNHYKYLVNFDVYFKKLFLSNYFPKKELYEQNTQLIKLFCFVFYQFQIHSLETHEQRTYMDNTAN